MAYQEVPGAKRVKFPVDVYLSDLFFNSPMPGAWDFENQCWKDDVLLMHANDLLHTLKQLRASELCSAKRLVEDFMERV